jgi:hypothetical protein
VAYGATHGRPSKACCKGDIHDEEAASTKGPDIGRFTTARLKRPHGSSQQPAQVGYTQLHFQRRVIITGELKLYRNNMIPQKTLHL